MKHLVVAIIVGGGVVVSGPARAGELDVAGGLGATTSAWDDDTGTSSSLKVGYFFDGLPWLAPIFLARFELVPVDDRMVHYFSLGAEARHRLGPLRGYLRLGLVHVHEESRSAFEDHPFQSILGIGDGLRHRAGGNAGLGLELPVLRRGASDLYVVLDLGGTAFADDRGPAWYASATIGLGYRWARGKAARPATLQVARAR
jgi:hypothetical protein